MRKNKIIGIYCIENIINHKKYIGQSINVYDRWNKHINELNHGTHDNDYLQKSWNKYGKDSFNFYVIEECVEEKLDEREIYYINFYNSLDRDYGYNLKEGGSAGILSEYSNQKKKESLKKAYSDSQLKQLRSESAYKQWSNPEIKAKIMGDNNGMYGKTHTAEAREKIGAAQRGRISPFRNSNPVLCVELNRVFKDSVTAKKELNINSPILQVCYGNRKTAGGYHWQFVENNI